MKKIYLTGLSVVLNFLQVKSQDTFSILAFDSITHEVGAAGASCVDLFPLTGYSNHFICELFPGVGAIATQASYFPTNQLNARNRMNAGDSPLQIINWLKANDAGSDPTVRQYGVVRMMPDSVQSAAHTGSNCMTYKNHIIGPNYTIHGNILLGQKVLDSMEARFKREPGDLACKLMAAMQGAKMVGADSRCASNGSSSLFAFLKVSPPTDTFGNPTFLVSLKTHANAGIEPIDSLQKLFTAIKTCTNDAAGLANTSLLTVDWVQLFPNPATNQITLRSSIITDYYSVRVLNHTSQVIFQSEWVNEINITTEKWAKGLYFFEIRSGNKKIVKKLVLD